MIDVQFVPQPDQNACALACYTMVAKHFFPETTIDEIAEISDWQKEYVVWPFKFWNWIMSKGIQISEYDMIDMEAWEIEGLEGLKKSVSEKEFNFYLQNTKNLESYSKDIKKVLANPNFNFHKQKPTFEMLRNAIVSGNVCEIVLDPRKLRNEEGFSLHRVVVLEINNIEVTFHDPAVGEFQKTSIENFTSAWLIAVNEPELCIYESKALNL
jgi:hypothetical protein